MPPPDPFRLDGRTALVTGASRGLGRALALALARRGADCVLLARTREALEEAATEIRALGSEAHVATHDLADVDGITSAFAAAEEAAGSIDLLVNAAGVTARGSAHELPLEDWRRVMAVNLDAMFALSRAWGASRIAAGAGGASLNIASLMTSRARPTTSAYTASKAGVAGLTRSLAVEWAPHGIRVNALAPGYFRTDLTAPLQTDGGFSAWVEERTPLGRWGRPDDLTGAAVWLLSDAASYVTGQVIYIDGGWTAAL